MSELKKYIKWERISKDTYKDDSNSVDAEDKYEEEEKEDHGPDLGAMLSGMGDVEFSLFGAHHKESLDNPFNLYNYDFMYMGHMVGFNANSPSFYRTVGGAKNLAIDFVLGVSVWKVIDSHKFVFIPAKYYDAEDVMADIEKILLENPNTDESLSMEKVLSANIVEEHIKTSKELLQKNINNAIILTPNGKSDLTIEDDQDYEKKLQQYQQLFDNVPDALLIINGERQSAETSEDMDTKKDPPEDES